MTQMINQTCHYLIGWLHCFLKTSRLDRNLNMSSHVELQSRLHVHVLGQETVTYRLRHVTQKQSQDAGSSEVEGQSLFCLNSTQSGGDDWKWALALLLLLAVNSSSGTDGVLNVLQWTVCQLPHIVNSSWEEGRRWPLTPAAGILSSLWKQLYLFCLYGAKKNTPVLKREDLFPIWFKTKQKNA